LCLNLEQPGHHASEKERQAPPKKKKGKGANEKRKRGDNHSARRNQGETADGEKSTRCREKKIKGCERRRRGFWGGRKRGTLSQFTISPTLRERGTSGGSTGGREGAVVCQQGGKERGRWGGGQLAFATLKQSSALTSRK